MADGKAVIAYVAQLRQAFASGGGGGDSGGDGDSGGGEGGGGGGDSGGGGSEAVDLPSGTGPASEPGSGPGSGNASRPSSADREAHERRDEEARLVRLGPQRRKSILSDLKGLKGEKAMPPWMVFKVAGTMLFNKIDLDDNPDDEPEDLGEYIE